MRQTGHSLTEHYLLCYDTYSDHSKIGPVRYSNGDKLDTNCIRILNGSGHLVLAIQKPDTLSGIGMPFEYRTIPL
jgi:hypothetical protein